MESRVKEGDKGTREILGIVCFSRSWLGSTFQENLNISLCWPAFLPQKTQGKNGQAFPFQFLVYKTNRMCYSFKTSVCTPNMRKNVETTCLIPSHDLCFGIWSSVKLSLLSFESTVIFETSIK